MRHRDRKPDRPRALYALAGLVLAACSPGPAETPSPAPAPTPEEAAVNLVIYSPAPPQIMLHAHNSELGEILAACGAFESVETPPVALPDSINQINALDPAERPYHLPIVTTLDYPTARDNTAPDWHGYTRANSDLLFVASLYDVSFGVLAFSEDIQSPDDLIGKRIAVPARPSAVRWFSEALLRDGWGILDQVELIDTVPPELPAAIAEGRVDATAWNIMSETPDGFQPMIAPLLDVPGAHWLGVSPETLDAVNTANPFTTELVQIEPGAILGAQTQSETTIPLLSFRQALTAWADTPDEVVAEMLGCLSQAAPGYGPGGEFKAAALHWPGLTDEMLHPAARAFYEGLPDTN
ncbi:MAG: ABC transporter substrate-binding protein [Hyphomonadaceae bacterium]|nr:ABC transporter substrate-binding protein [Hyphomonadaceae bacterium]